MDKNDISNGQERLAISIELDENDKLPPPFTYTKSCVSGPGVNLPKEPFYPGCQCTDVCSVDGQCSCLLHYGPAYERKNGLVILKDEVYQITGFSQPVFECNLNCICSKSCGNRLVQNGISLRLQVFPTDHKDWGLRTLESIAKGQFVCEYAGEVISFSEAKKRTQAQHGSNNYIIVIKEHVSGNQVLRTHVDPIYHGNAGRFINHSCDPNLVMIPVRVHSLIPILALFAVKEIPENSELTFDYSGGNTLQESIEKHSVSSGSRRCHCQSVRCTGYLPCDPTLF